MTPGLPHSHLRPRPDRPEDPRQPQRRHLPRQPRHRRALRHRHQPARGRTLPRPAQPARPLRTRQPQRGRRQRDRTLRLPTRHARSRKTPVGGPSSTPADTAFPIAQSEGLAKTPPPSATPAVPAGQAHAQVTVPLVYKSDAPPPPPPPNMAPETPPATTAAAPSQPPAKKQTGFFHGIGHFFSKLFGGK